MTIDTKTIYSVTNQNKYSTTRFCISQGAFKKGIVGFITDIAVPAKRPSGDSVRSIIYEHVLQMMKAGTGS